MRRERKREGREGKYERVRKREGGLERRRDRGDRERVCVRERERERERERVRDKDRQGR